MIPGQRSNTEAFTLVEVLVASAILVLMLGFLLVAMDQMARVWAGTVAKVEQFRDARFAFERVTSRLAQATLNAYWDYDSPTRPTRYLRQSELRFSSGSATTLLGKNGTTAGITHAVFFNATLGVTGNAADASLTNALNTIGYFVGFGDDTAQRPGFITAGMVAPRWRFRLMEFTQPTESFSLYRFTSGNPAAVTTAWFTADANVTTGMNRVIAENVIALVVTPRLAKAEELPLQTNATHSPLAPNYSYDSTSTNANPQLNPKNQLPPVVQLTMVAIDDKSADFLGLDSTKANVFGTSQLFSDTRNFTADLATLQGTLGAGRIRYRTFTTNVQIRAAKWSREQAN